MQFEFNNQLMPQNVIEIEEIGNFAMEASNDDGYFWYMLIKTSLGTTTIATSGPIVPDVTLLPSGYSVTLNKIPYKEDKINKTINFWLNDRGKGITEAKVIPQEDALKEFRDLREYLTNYSEDIY